MSNLVVSINMTLDGVIQDPMGDEGTPAGGWSAAMSDGDRGAWAKTLTEEALAASALLMGGRTYDWFAPRWVVRDGAWADRLKELPKYVVATTITGEDWGPVTVLDGDIPARVREAKASAGGDVLVFGSGHLLPLLFDNGLVDELRLFVFPVVAGSGRRLFDGIAAGHSLELMDAASLGDQVTRMQYLVR